MRRLVSQRPVLNENDFINTVRELVPAILDMNRRITVRNEPAVYIRDPRHITLIFGKDLRIDVSRRSEKVEPYGKESLHLFDGLVGCKDHDPITRLDDGFAARTTTSSPRKIAPTMTPFGRRASFKGRPTSGEVSSASASITSPKSSAGIDAPNAASAHMLQNGRHRDGARINDRINTKLRDERGIGARVDQETVRPQPDRLANNELRMLTSSSFETATNVSVCWMFASSRISGSRTSPLMTMTLPSV